MDIVKRNGRKVLFNPQKLIKRLTDYQTDVDLRRFIDRAVIDCQNFFYNGITTTEIDQRLAQCVSQLSILEPEMAFLGGHIIVTSIEKDVALNDYDYTLNPMLLEGFINKYREYKRPNAIQSKMSYFAAYTMKEEFLLKNEFEKIVETPLDFYWRIAVANSLSNSQANGFYKELVDRGFATSNPIAVNSGTDKGKLISCTTLSITEDSKEGIKEAMNSAADHSANNSGLGIYIGDVRSKLTKRSRGGTASGIRRLVKMLTPLSAFYRQHEKRRGAFAMYCDIWHRDIRDFIPMKRQDLSHSLTDQDGFYGVCVPDLFYKRFEKGEDWSLFCPHDVYKNYGWRISDFTGEQFEEKYLKIESEGLVDIDTVSSSELMMQLVDAMAASGVPYVFNRDHANKNHQQKHLGILKSYQLCIEFAGMHNKDVEAQCDLGSIPLPSHVKNGKFDFKSLSKSVKQLTRLLNNVIDINEWNTDKARNGGLTHRNIGIGIVGLADVFAMLDMAYGDESSKELNIDIQKAIYIAALEESNLIAKETGKGSKDTLVCREPQEWLPEELKESVAKYGVMNHLLCCNMPTSTTSKLLDITQSFEVFDFPVSYRETVLGEFKQINRHLVKDLKKLGFWNDEVAMELVVKNDVSALNFLPEHIKNKYINKYKHSNKVYLEMAADRQKFIDQGQSMNLYYDKPERSKISTALYYGWKLGLPSGSYYTTILKQKDNNDLIATQVSKPENSKFDCFNCD
tara:strand:+ start:9469 stop:11685 length:2217 start_codon:yes stop_codon:yes gene_type:complete